MHEFNQHERTDGPIVPGGKYTIIGSIDGPWAEAMDEPDVSLEESQALTDSGVRALRLVSEAERRAAELLVGGRAAADVAFELAGIEPPIPGQ